MLYVLFKQHIFGSYRSEIDKYDAEGMFICWNTQLKSCVIAICNNKDYLGCDLNELKNNKSCFYSIKLKNDDVISTGSIVHESTVKFPTCANDIQLLASITQSFGSYRIGHDFFNCRYLKSYEIVSNLLKIIYKQFKDNQTTILPQTECKQEQNLQDNQSIKQETRDLRNQIQDLKKKIETLENVIATQKECLRIKHKKLCRIYGEYNVCHHKNCEYNYNIMFLWFVCFTFTK